MLRVCGTRITRARLLHNAALARTFHLRARPGLIPAFANVWTPTTPQSAAIPTAEHEQTVVVRDAAEESVRRAKRKEICANQQVVVNDRYPDAPPLLQLLNHYLRRAHRSSLGYNPRLWRSYVRAKGLDTSLIWRMPDRAWEIMWATESRPDKNNPNRRHHLETLYEDMMTAGKRPTHGQRLAYLHSLFHKGQKARALREWDDDYSQLNQISPEHLELGVVMHGLVDHPDRSLEIMEELLYLYPDRDPSVILAVFRAHTRSSSIKHHETARTLYTKLKSLVQHGFTLNMYDACLVGFLESRDLQQAKSVFGDMVTSGHLGHCTSKARINETFQRLHLLYRLGTDIEKMTSIALVALSVLPKAYHAHLFGDMMKAVVIRKAPEAGAQILDMMLRRGLDPTVFNFNLLISCLLRTKETEHTIKAKNIGWQMVDQARQSGGMPRHSELRYAADAVLASANGKTVQSSATHDLSSHIPAANVTTYALLMQHHASKFEWEQVDYVARRLKESNIQPDSRIMTILMDNQCRQGRYNEVWNIYQSCTNPPEGKNAVFPDGKAMRCLWKSLRLALGEHSSGDNSLALPTPRDLLQMTLEWWDLVKSRYDAKRFKIGFSAKDYGAISGLVMHCFSYTKDLPGSLVAIHALRQRFDIFPTENAATILQRHVAWTDMQRETEAVRQSYARSGIHRKRVERMGHIHHILQQQRFKRLELTANDFANLSEDETKDLGLNILSEFVRVVLKRQHPPEEVEAMIERAKEEIGLPELQTGDMTAFEVA